MNKLILIFLILFSEFCTFPKENTNEKNFISLLLVRSSILPSSGSGNNFDQFTPNQANWNTFLTKITAAGLNGHDPDSITWISKSTWDNARWDGKTIYDPTKMTRAEFETAICPNAGDTIRGIREVFYRTNPFRDNKNPTKAEVDEWHRIALNHVRALVGYTTADRLVQKDHCMFKRALWGDERQNTRMWDAKYPGTDGSAAGPCVGGTNAHCGASFIPSATDQAPYFIGTPQTCVAGQGSEGITSAPKSNIPWSIKWSRGFCGFLGGEGFWGGHVGPFFHREKFGFNFWDAEQSNNNSNAVLRAKWTGKRMPSLYNDPAIVTDSNSE